MTTAYRHFSAGERDELGLDGTRAEHLWIVEDAANSTAAINAVIAQVPMNAPHPDLTHFPGIVCRGYSLGEHLNETSWQVFVRYGAVTDEVIGQWTRAVRYSSESFDLERSLAVLADDGEVEDAREPWLVSQAIGDPDFREPKIIENAGTQTSQLEQHTHFAEPGHKPLVATGRLKPEHLTINRGVLGLTYAITVPQISAAKLKRIDDLKWHCNDGIVFGVWDPWELIFSNFQAEDFVMTFPSAFGAVAAWYSHVTVEILRKKIHPIHDPFGWRGVQRQVKWPDDKGYALQVTTLAGAPLYNNWATYEETNFDAIWNEIGAGPPPN